MGLVIGFTTILVVIAAGAALAHVGVLDLRSQRTLGEIAFVGYEVPVEHGP